MCKHIYATIYKFITYNLNIKNNNKSFSLKLLYKQIHRNIV